MKRMVSTLDMAGSLQGCEEGVIPSGWAEQALFRDRLPATATRNVS
jgi:hypothetical protein